MSNLVNSNLKEQIGEELDRLFFTDSEFKEELEAWTYKISEGISKDEWEKAIENSYDRLYYLLSEDYLEEVYYTGVKATAIYHMRYN